MLWISNRRRKTLLTSSVIGRSSSYLLTTSQSVYSLLSSTIPPPPLLHRVGLCLWSVWGAVGGSPRGLHSAFGLCVSGSLGSLSLVSLFSMFLCWVVPLFSTFGIQGPPFVVVHSSFFPKLTQLLSLALPGGPKR